MEVPVKLAGEGILDLAVLRRLARDIGLTPGDEYDLRGAGGVDRKLPKYNAAAKHWPWIVVRDLDSDPCAGALARSLLPLPAEWMRLRIAVKSIESWVLADPESLSEKFGVRIAAIPGAPDELPNPKLKMLQLMASSRNRDIRESMLRARPGVKLEPGPQYNVRLSQFVENQWDRQSALGSSPSLTRAWNRLEEFAARINARWGRE